MFNRKSTKSALLTSAIALMLCLSMLVGTTFAWFTDSVTSTNNIIKSGNLDVELYYQVEGQTDWTKVTKDTNIFKENALWEPGYTEVVKLKVVNEGSLALKYQLGVNVASEIGSVNVAGDEFKLSDYIKYGIVDGEQSYTRAQAIAAVDATAETLANPYVSETVKLLALDGTNTDNEDIVTVVVYMPETVGNEANYAAPATAPVINLGINLLATQVEAEVDSFGNDYDKNAVFDSAKPVANTKVISKSENFTLDDGTEILGKDFAIKTSITGSFGTDIGDANGALNLDSAYQFEPTMSFEEVQLSEYEQWHADFVVYVDKAIPQNSIALAGYYNYWCENINNNKWVALTNEGLDIGANEQIRLVDAMSNGALTVALKDLSQYGNDGIGFLCGVKELNNLLEDVKFTVELRLYEATDPSRGSETGNYITVGKYSYYFE